MFPSLTSSRDVGVSDRVQLYPNLDPTSVCLDHSIGDPIGPHYQDREFATIWDFSRGLPLFRREVLFLVCELSFVFGEAFLYRFQRDGGGTRCGEIARGTAVQGMGLEDLVRKKVMAAGTPQVSADLACGL